MVHHGLSPSYGVGVSPAEADALTRLDDDIAALWSSGGASLLLPACDGDDAPAAGRRGQDVEGEPPPAPAPPPFLTAPPAAARAPKRILPHARAAAAAAAAVHTGASRLLPASAVDALSAWLWAPEHFRWPYPTRKRAHVRCLSGMARLRLLVVVGAVVGGERGVLPGYDAHAQPKSGRTSRSPRASRCAKL